LEVFQLPIEAEMAVTDFITEAWQFARKGYREIAMNVLLDARKACQPNFPRSDGNVFWEGLAKVCFAEGEILRHHRSSFAEAVAAYEEALECFSSSVFVYDHFDERPEMVEEALWQIFALNLKLYRFRAAARAARRALDGIRYPVVPGKAYATTRVLGTYRLPVLTLFAGLSSG
jgi:hypothetical protein